MDSRNEDHNIRTNDGSLEILFGNVTSWSDKAKEYFQQSGAPVKMVAEHHITRARAPAFRRYWRRNGSKVNYQEAKATDGGSSGGTAVAIRKDLNSYSDPRGVRGGVSEARWTGSFLRMRGYELFLGCIYGYTGEEDQGRNQELFMEVFLYLKGLKCQYVVVGDWNVEYGVMMDSHLMAHLGGVVIPPRNTTYTCGSGQMRTIDFVITTKELAPFVEVEAALDVPWSPHLGLKVRVSKEVEKAEVWVMETPNEIPVHKGPVRHDWSWYACEAESSRCTGTAHSVAAGARSEELTAQYESFSKAAEAYKLDRGDEKAAGMTGRGQARRFVRKPAIPRHPPGATASFHKLAFWAALATRLREAALSGACRIGDVRTFAHWDWIAGQIDLMEKHNEEPGEGVEDWASRIRAAVREVAEACEARDPQQVRSNLMKAYCLAHRVAGKVQTEDSRQRKESHRAWLDEHLRSKLGAVARLTKEDSLPLDIVEEVTQEAGSLCTPDEVMEHRSNTWMKLWCPGGGAQAPHDPEWANVLREKGLREDEESYSVEEVAEAVRRADPKAARGADVWRPRDWADLPDEGMAQLTSVVNGIIKELRWPDQALLNLVVMLPKPGPTPAERPITLTTGIFRLVGALQKKAMTRFEAGMVGFWDTAVRGSDALLAAVLREVRNEIAKAHSLTTVEVLFDMAKFYDSIPPEQVAITACSLGFPLRSLVLGLQVHMATRRLRAGGTHSGEIYPTTSIVAGCTRSVCWSRCLLYQVLDDLHKNYRPLEVQSWVDDLAARVSHTREIAIAKAVEGSVALVEGLRARGCKLSPKSVVIASNPKVAKEVVEKLGQRGIQVGSALRARDLGSDCSAASRRTVQVQKGRLTAARKRLMRIKGLVRAHGEARKLVKIAGKPQGTWGHQAQGLAPSTLRSWRASVMSSLGFRYNGGCCTVAFALHAPGADPMIQVPLEQLRVWGRVLNKLDEAELRAAATAWRRRAAELLSKGEGRWRHVHGCLSATIATVMDAGWRPRQLLHWLSPEGTEWELDPEDPSLGSELGEVLQGQVIKRTWQAAAKHLHGKGLEEGADMTVMRRLHKYLVKKGQVQLAGCLSMVAQGAYWDADRREDCGYPFDEQCPRCGGSRPNAAHQFWGECQYSAELEKHLKLTDHLKNLAKEDMIEYP